MTRNLDGPADTAMMGIVHDALRRDLARMRTALAAGPLPRQRRALAAHLDWMMDFLHAHHEGEDAGLYPMVRAADPAAAPLLDEMAADHARIDPAVEVLRAATDRWARTGAGRDALRDALVALEDLLLPHLDREVEQAMPVVSRAITHRQWHAWDQEHNIAPKSMPRLAEEGLWLMEGLDPRRRAVVEAEVPWPVRMVVLYGFGPGYRRRAAARWGDPGPAPEATNGAFVQSGWTNAPLVAGDGGVTGRVPRSGVAEVVVDAAPDAVWAVLADVTRIGEWSHECHGAEWLDGARAPAPGVRFRGRNRARRAVRWSRVCEVLTADAPRELAWRTVGPPPLRDATEWRVRLEPAGSGTRVRQEYRILTLPGWAERLISVMIPAHRDRTDALEADLRRLGSVAAQPRGDA
ncbi:MAG: hemerythrin domain-containing protein, partial [Pseudonocardia sp.]